MSTFVLIACFKTIDRESWQQSWHAYRKGQAVTAEDSDESMEWDPAWCQQLRFALPNRGGSTWCQRKADPLMWIWAIPFPSIVIPGYSSIRKSSMQRTQCLMCSASTLQKFLKSCWPKKAFAACCIFTRSMSPLLWGMKYLYSLYCAENLQSNLFLLSP